MRDKVGPAGERSCALGSAETFYSISGRNYSGCLESFLRDMLNDGHEGVLEAIISARSFLSAASFLSSLMKEFPDKRLKMHIFYDPADFSSPADYCRFICKACSQFPSIDIDISEVKIPRLELSDLLCIVQNSAMLVKAFGVFGNSFPAYVSDFYDVNFQYDTVMSLLRDKTFDSYSYGDSQYERYLFKFYEPKGSAQVSTLTNEMAIPSVYIMLDNGIQDSTIGNNYSLERLKWYAMLNQPCDSCTRNFYYESALIDFCRSGKGRIGPDNYEPVIFSAENRKIMINKLIQSIEEGKKPIYFLTDTNPILNCRDLSGSIAYNGGLVCTIPAGSRQVTYIKTPYAVDSFRAIFEDFLSLSDDYIIQGKKPSNFCAMQ